LFNWLIVGQVITTNPAQPVRGPRFVVTKGSTPVLTSQETRRLMDSIRVVAKVTDENGVVEQAPVITGLRDRAFIAVMVYSFARVGAVIKLKVRDYFFQGGRKWLRLHEKAGRVDAIPCHHVLEQYLDEYIAAAGIAGDPDGQLFRTTGRKTGKQQAMWQQDGYRMIQRHARNAGIMTKIGNHTFRATGITVYLKGGGHLEVAQKMAGHRSPQTTGIYDRRPDEVSHDQVELISI
jgi:integrase/recombinase XerD